MVPCRRLALKVALVAQPVIAAVQMKRGRHVDSRLATAPANGPANGVNVLQKIQELHAEGDTVCFSVNEQNLYGGLSETVGIVNHALRFALQHDDMVEFVMPEIRPPIRRSADDYRFMFGEQEVCEPRLGRNGGFQLVDPNPTLQRGVHRRPRPWHQRRPEVRNILVLSTD